MRGIRVLIWVSPVVKPLMILVAGPYRSGTNDDPVLIKRTSTR